MCVTDHHLVQELVDQSEVHADGFLTHAAAVILNQSHEPARDTSEHHSMTLSQISTITRVTQKQKVHSKTTRISGVC